MNHFVLAALISAALLAAMPADASLETLAPLHIKHYTAYDITGDGREELFFYVETLQNYYDNFIFSLKRRTAAIFSCPKTIAFAPALQRLWHPTAQYCCPP